MTGKEAAANYRALAELAERVPHGPYVGSTDMIIVAHTSEEVAQTVKAIGGKWQKDNNENNMLIIQTVTDTADIRLVINHAHICERVKTGTLLVPAQPERTLPATPQHEEDVYEWKCPESILA